MRYWIMLQPGNENWFDIWQRKGRRAAGKASYGIDDLFAADGFDGAMAQTGEAAQAHIRELIVGSLGIGPGSRVLEAGCGAGAVLSLLMGTGAELAGADFSAPHIEIARQVLCDADLRVGAADALPWADGSFDAVFSYGVFLYFADLSYAERAIAEMVRVARPGAPILILDIPDAAKQEECEASRRAAGAALHPPHCYYPKSFFDCFGSTFDQQVPGYANSAFRFNALFSTIEGC